MRNIRQQKAISVIVTLAITLTLVGIGVPAHAQTFTPLYAFGAAPNGFDAFPTGTLALGRDGNFYGTTNFNESNVFEITPGGAETLLWDSGQGTGDQCEFGGINNSAPYFGGLTLGGDGNLYGTCWLYTFNTDSGGVIFKFVPSEGQAGFSALYTFPGPFGASGRYTPENMPWALTGISMARPSAPMISPKAMFMVQSSSSRRPVR